MATKPSTKKAARKVAKKPKKTKAPIEKKKPRLVTPPDSCAICRYFVDVGMKTGACRRYPSPPGFIGQSSMPIDGWCGEFKKIS